MAIRSGYYKRINVTEVKAGELKKWNPFTEELELEAAEDADRENLKTIGYVASFEYLNGFTKTIYWSYEKMLQHADTYSKAFSAKKYNDLLDGKIPQGDLWKYSSFWYKDFDAMAKKTMLRQLISKWGIMSTELQTAFEHDDKITTADSADGGVIFGTDEAMEAADVDGEEVRPTDFQKAQGNIIEAEAVDISKL